MKPLFAIALSLCLTPAFAQYAPPPPPDPQQSPDAQQSPEAQPAPAPPSATAPNSAPRPERRRLERPSGITPRVDAAAYPVSRRLSQFSLGAQLLSTKELERRLSTPLGKRYVVVEVGVFPAGSQHVNFRPVDFTLRVGSENQGFFASTPEDIAADLTGEAPRTAVRPAMGVGVGPWGPTVGVGVGAYPYPPRTGVRRDSRVIEEELRDKSLPEWNLTQPVAGYLYFPVTPKRGAHYTLDLTWNGETVSLALPDPKK
jgi:hypothetical protein